MQYFFSFISALVVLIVTSGILFLVRKNIRSRCGEVKDCASCKGKCSRSIDD